MKNKEHFIADNPYFPENSMSEPSTDIAVDDRERESGIAGILQTIDGLRISEQRLPLGDYMVDKRVLIERKTIHDLGVSIVDGRLFRQAIRMKKSSYRPMFIIEGTLQKQTGGLTREAVQGAMITLTLILGIPCLRSFDPADTANLIRFVAGQVTRVDCRTVYRHGYRPNRRRKRQLYILQGLPGIGPGKAELLLDALGSVGAIFNADLDALSGIPGIGSKTAATIREIIEPTP